MKFKYVGLFLFFVTAQFGVKLQTVAAQSSRLCAAQLSPTIENITNRPQFQRLRWGILVQSLATSQTLYSRDAQKFFIPASNVKLLTTAAVLQRLGSQFRFRTSVYNDNGALRVVGRGDPSLTDVELQQLAQQISRRGGRFNRLIVEDRYRGAVVNPTWEWEDLQADYGAPVSSLIVNQNAVELKLLPRRVGQPPLVQWQDPGEAVWWRVANEASTVSAGESSTVNVRRELEGAVLKITGQISVDAEPQSVNLAVIDPAENFLRRFRRALSSQGIAILQAVVAANSNNNLPALATVLSPPLSQLLVETNQNSNNLYAEALVNAIAPDSTADVNLEVVNQTLTTLGVDSTGYILADGSGLSRHNLASPEALVQTLRVMANSGVYRASLPLAGVSGTLQNRFQNTPAQGIVQAKTGTMSGVVALSGYLSAASYEPLIFSILVNQSNLSAAAIRQAIDEVVVTLARLHRC